MTDTEKAVAILTAAFLSSTAEYWAARLEVRPEQESFRVPRMDLERFVKATRALSLHLTHTSKDHSE